MTETIKSVYKKYLECNSVSTDTRTLQPGAFFVALNGPNFKGSQFVAQAFEKGAHYVITDDVNLASNRCLAVEDPLKFLQDLARYHRLQLQIPVLGITGSNGKTTTKELINSVLKKKFNTLYTKGNLNNHIGVPLTVLTIKPEHEIAIIEMGANHIGEIGFLCTIANPTHGLITNIGKAHLEGFGSLEGVARGKSELYLHLDQHNGTVFVNMQDEHLMRMARRIENKILYGGAGSYFTAHLQETSPNVIFKSENGEVVETQLPGRYNYENMCAAACIGKYLGVEIPQINDAIATYTPDNNRSQVIKTQTNSILLDAYNANPTSMTLALENFSKIEAAQKVVILGDMYELGTDSKAEHHNLGKLLATAGFEKVILCGKEMRAAAEVSPDFMYFEARNELQDWLVQHPLTNSSVLIKGSRSMGLEKLVEVL